ncbi:MAG: putative baseplate assembly protein [Alphaproteobacteria bacterium]|nr:putative baseplate assembly protein [Alphaproteobacteria bacterium]
MSDSTALPCFCCEGVTRETPAVIWNRPGLSQISYRAGRHASFKASLLASLSDPSFAALGPLTTRDDGDFSIALLDAFAVSADILTFYQERLANESYLRTAVQQRSVFELARLVGYQPSPGVSASAPLAFTLNDAPGAPDPAVIPAGTRVQSVPAPGQQPATFETEAPLTARIAHNAILPVAAQPVNWTGVSTSLWLTGTATGLNPGDAILFVDADRLANTSSELWEFRFITAVRTDAANDRTRVTWDVGLFTQFQNGASNVQLYALRRRASLFGVNAPDPATLKKAIDNLPAGDWKFIHDASHVDLDTTYPAIAPVSAPASDFTASPERFAWLVLSDGSERKLYRITAAADRAPLRYTLSAKATGLSLDKDDFLKWFVDHTRGTTAFVQSEPLPIALQPLIDWSGAPPALASGMLRPVAGSGEAVAGGGMLASGQTVAVIGKRPRLRLGVDPSATLVGSDGFTPIPVAQGDVLLADAYPPTTLPSGATTWSVLTTQGIAATLTAQPSALTLLPADKGDADVSEAVVLETVTLANAGQTALTFTHELARIYDRATVSLNANVVGGTHGETVQEILGSADASQPNQSFTLKQSPLTYLSTPSGQGVASTLQVWVNDLRWHEQPSLLNAATRDRVFQTRAQPGGAVTVQFGDGQHGARPPTGQTNVRAVYRKGLGLSGMVAAGQLSNAIDRPPGLKSVMNPAAATGGADPDTPADARRSAPLHVLTLERVVSLQDYQDFSAAFAGVAQALATWTWSGSARGVVVTVAGPGGAALDPDGETIANLAAALRDSGNRYVPVTVLPYQAKRFEIAGLVRIDTSTYDPAIVLAAVRAALLTAFGFDARALGQGVAQSEVIAAMQAVPGVQGVKLSHFSRADIASALPDVLPAAAPLAGARGVIAGAELLLIDPLSLPSVEQWP